MDGVTRARYGKTHTDDGMGIVLARRCSHASRTHQSLFNIDSSNRCATASNMLKPA